MVGYFQELKEELQENPLAEFLCSLANSKGKMTPYSLLKGIEKLVFHQQTAQQMEQYNLSNDDIEAFLQRFMN